MPRAATPQMSESLVVYDNTLGAVMRFKQMIQPGDTRFDAVPLHFKVQMAPEVRTLLRTAPMIKESLQLETIALVATEVFGMGPPSPGATYNGDMKRRLELVMDSCADKINAALDKKLSQHALNNDAWNKYYKNQRKELIFAAVGVGLAALSVGLAVPTGGASVGLAIVGGARALITGATKLFECWRTVEHYEHRIIASTKVLAEAYGRSVHQGRAMQITGGMMTATGLTAAVELLPFIRQDLLPNVTKIKGDLKIYKGKLGHLYEVANKLAVQLFEQLDKLDEWERMNPGQDSSTAPGLASMRKKIDDLLQAGQNSTIGTTSHNIKNHLQVSHGIRGKVTIGSCYARYERGMTVLETLETKLNDCIGLENHPRRVAITVAVMKTLVNACFTLANYNQGVTALASPDHAFSLSDNFAMGMQVFNPDGTLASVPSISGTAMSWSSDVIGTAKDMADLREDCRVPETEDTSVIEAELAARYNSVAPIVAPRAAAPSVNGRVARPAMGTPTPLVQAQARPQPPVSPPPPTPARAPGPPASPPPGRPQVVINRNAGRPPRPARP